MTWLLIAALAQLTLGTSAVFDKLLLRRGVFDPWVYTFWVGILGIFSLVLVPFGFESVSLGFLLLALLAGSIFILAVLFMFLSLHRGEASEILPIIGSLSPVFTLIAGLILLSDKLSFVDLIGFSFLVAGSVIIFLSRRDKSWLKSGSLLVSSAVLFGLSNVLAKLVFDETNFVTGFVLIKLGGILAAILFLVYPSVVRSLFSSKSDTVPSNKFLYLLNRGYAGVGSLLVNVAIFMAHPALVDATQSFRYIIIFLASWFLLKEISRGRVLVYKIIATFLVVTGFVWLGFVGYARSLPALETNRPVEWGITFSEKFTDQLGIDAQETLTNIMTDLKPKKVRLVAYWDELEKEKGIFDFSNLDSYIATVENGEAKIILAMGMKTPRWPECHIPDWADALSPEERQQELMNYIEAVVNKYHDNENVIMWQVENEPFLFFGQCPGRVDDFMKQEVDLVKSLDSSRPILATDGGEAGRWFKAARYGDVFGSTMYRRVYSARFGWLVGVVDYPLSPSFFRLKENIVRWLINDYEKPFIIIELQSEPWGELGTPELNYERQTELFSLDYFKETIRFAKDTGFDEYYLWGGEWWYYLKTEKNDSRYWDYAKDIFKSSI